MTSIECIRAEASILLFMCEISTFAGADVSDFNRVVFLFIVYIQLLTIFFIKY